MGLCWLPWNARSEKLVPTQKVAEIQYIADVQRRQGFMAAGVAAGDGPIKTSKRMLQMDLRAFLRSADSQRAAGVSPNALPLPYDCHFLRATVWSLEPSCALGDCIARQFRHASAWESSERATRLETRLVVAHESSANLAAGACLN